MSGRLIRCRRRREHTWTWRRGERSDQRSWCHKKNSRQGAKTPRSEKKSSELRISDFSVLAGLASWREFHLSVIGAQLGWRSTRSHHARIVGYGARSKPPSCATCVYAYSAMSASE